MAHRPEDIRNAALVGAGGAGKTTLLEAVLHLAKATSRRGSIEEKNTVSDWDEDERERQQSIVATPAHLTWEGKKIQLIDAPGALDFIGEAICALAAVDIAVICVNAHDGVSVSTRRIYKSARQAGIPCCIVVTRIEMDNVDGPALLDSIQAAFGEEAVPINIPDAYGPGAEEVIDVFGSDVPAEMEDQATNYRRQARDRVVEVDDALLEKYIEEGSISQEELEHAFPRALRAGNIVPVLHVSAEKGVGMRKLLTFLVHDCPAPAPTVLRPAVDADGESVKLAADGPFSGQVWKIQVDPHVGKLAYLRVWTGQLASKSQFEVVRTGQTERIGDLLQVQGKEMHAVSEAVAGDLVAVAKIDDIRVGDTVRAEGANWQFVPIDVPYPKVTQAIEPKNRGDETKLGPELHRLDEADPTFIAEREEATGEMVVRGMSSLHLDIMMKRLARKKVEVIMHPPRVPYRETVSANGDAQYRHKKQTGGRGQFAEVHLRVAPLERGGEFEFVDQIVGGSIPRNFLPAVEKGIRETLVKGVIAGYPFTDVKVTVYDGKYHDVDSDEFSFKLASSAAFRRAVESAKPILLEPIMDVEIEVPARFMGDITGDLNSRRGRILGMDQVGEMAEIKAQVPLSEMMQYSTELRSITAGEGDYSFRFAHYEQVPSHVAEQVIARHKKELQEEHA
jgi:elongation factor G